MKIFVLLLLLVYCSGKQYKQYYMGSSYYEEKYSTIIVDTKTTPTSTIPTEISTSSFYNLKSQAESSILPSFYSISTEQLLNYFIYKYPEPEGEKDFSIYSEVAISPWHHENKLVHIGIQGKKIETVNQSSKSNHLIFAIDHSSSMSSNRAMELFQYSMKGFIQGLQDTDTISIITYNDFSSLVLPKTKGTEKDVIYNSINSISSVGGTNTWPAIQLAYKMAKENQEPNGNTQIIIVTDGDFGGVNRQEFSSLMESAKPFSISLSILIYGMEKPKNAKDSIIDFFTEKEYAKTYYINDRYIATKYLYNQIGLDWNSDLKDLKIQVEFDPNTVEWYRHIGYENTRVLSQKKSKGNSIFPGYSVTALYEIRLKKGVDLPNDLLKVKIEYQKNNSVLQDSITVQDSNTSTWDASETFRFSAGIAGFGMLSNHSIYPGKLDKNMVIHLLQNSMNYDPYHYRSDFFKIAAKAL